MEQIISECVSAGWVIFPVCLSYTRVRVYAHTDVHRDAPRNYLHAHTEKHTHVIKIKGRKLTTICKEAYITITPGNLHK